LALLAALAVTTRIALLDHQSLWFDEIVSVTLAKQSLATMLHAIATTESTPPLYYLVLWVWTRLFGFSAVAVRSLSVCFGVLTVLAIYLTARVRFSGRAAFVAAALAATNPMLIWYSQETRSYSLLTLLVTLTLYFFLRVRVKVSVRDLAAWSICASLALATHYFAAFVVFPEAALLVWFGRWRVLRPLAAVVLPLATAAALLPLAIHQRNTGHTEFLAGIPLSTRAQQAANELLLGRYAISALHLFLLGLAIAIATAIALARSASAGERRDVLTLVAIALAGFLVPLAVTPDAFFYRNLIVVLPPLLLVAGVACATFRGGAVGMAVGCVVAAALIIPTVVTAERPALQREDWRDMPALIGRGDTPRAILVYPRFEWVSLAHYDPRLRVVDSGDLRVRELVVVGRSKLDTLRLPKGFHRVEDRRIGTLRLLRLEAPRARVLDVGALNLPQALPLLRNYPKPVANQDTTLFIDPSRS
jgi:uncharacterized membrane protein